MNQDLIKRGDFRVMDAGVDPIDDVGMNEVEVILLTLLDNAMLAPNKVALRILNDTYVVAARFQNGKSITLTFDAKHIPGMLTKKDYDLIAEGIIAHYRESIIPQKSC